MLRPTIHPHTPADIIDLKTRQRFDPSGRTLDSHPRHRELVGLQDQVDALAARCWELENALYRITDDVAKLNHIGHRTDSASCDGRLSTLLRIGSSILEALRSGRASEATHTGGAA